jgi:hypothetical protein
MRTYLRHDAGARELRLVMTDYYNGQHERTEYTVVNSDDEPIRRMAELDGLRVHGGMVTMPSGARVPVRTMPGQRSATQRTDCPKAANRRRKCSLCTTEER